MTLQLELDVPEDLAREARAAGLLSSAAYTDWLRDELRRRQAGVKLVHVLREIQSQPGEPPPMEELVAEVEAVRAERRRKTAG